jgi:hypothetical protein
MRPGQLSRPVESPAVTGPRRLLEHIVLVPLVCAVAYLAIVVVRFTRIIADIHLNPDASWAPVLARDLGSGARGGHILVGGAAHYTTIWFLVLTRWLPFRDALWDAAPFLMFLLGLGFVAWACQRVAGRSAALLTAAIGVGANAAVLLTVMSEGIHGATYFADGVLAAFLVYWAAGTRSRPRSLLWPGAVAVAAVILLAGATLASDTLFLASGLGPFFGAPIALWVLRRDRLSGRMALGTTGITAASVVVALGANRWMQALGYQKTYETNGYAFVSGHVAWLNLRKFGRVLRLLGNGTAASQPFGPREMVYLVMVTLLVGAVVAPFVLLFHSVRTKPRWSDEIDVARFLYLAFWILGGVAVCAAFSLTAFADGPSDPSRYVAPAFFSIAAATPVWAARVGWRRITVALGVALFCVLSITERQSLFLYGTAFQQTATQGPKVIAFLEDQGVTTGYTGYFDSHPLTLRADARVHFYPVLACRSPVSPRLCPFFVNARTSWYFPRPDIRSFVLFDSKTPAYIASIPTGDLGVPKMTRQFGALYVFIYDYDVASRLAAPCPSSSPNQFFCPDSAP